MTSAKKVRKMKKGIIAAIITLVIAIAAIAFRIITRGAGAVGELFTPVKN